MRKFNVPVKETYEDFIQTDNIWLTINENKDGFQFFKKDNKSELLIGFSGTKGHSISQEKESSVNLNRMFSELEKASDPSSLLYTNAGYKKIIFSPRGDLCFVLIKRSENTIFIFNQGPPSKPELFIEEDVAIAFDRKINKDLADRLKDLVLGARSFSYTLMDDISSITHSFGNDAIPIAIVENTPHQSYKFPVKSSLKTVSLAVGMIKNKLVQYNTEKIWQIETVLHEALVNAVTYGNGLDPEKPVMMNYELGLKGLRVFIADSGEGFDVGDISVPVGLEALEKISGRGIYIMKKFSDALFYNRTGTGVVLFFNFN